MSILCSMVGASFSVAAAAQVLRAKVGITANGNAQVDTAQSKFGGSSLLLDGTGDWLETTGINISRSDNFTCEAWIRLAALPGTNSFSMLLSGVGGGEQYMSIKNISGTYVSDIVVGNGTTIREEDYTIPSISTNTWYHWAIVKNGSTLTHYFNGTALTTLLSSQGTMTSGHGFNAINKIGVYSNNSLGWNGHIDEIRVSNSARYTANFTPSTTPFVNDANTVLLLHMNGTDASTFFEDDNGLRAQAGITAVGNAQIDTAQSKFGGASALFDGTGDFLTVTPTTGLADLMNGDFTIEFYMNSPETGIDGTYGDSIIGIDGGGSGSNGWVIRNYGSKLQWVYDGQGGYDVATFNPSANTWHHIAFVRSGTTLKCYTDGTERTVTSYADRKSNSGSYNIRIGKVYSGQNDDYNGYLDEIRVSNTARYTAAFTAPTAPFTNDANTLLLIHADGTDASTVFRDDNGARAPKGIQAIGNAQIDTAQSKFGGSSALFDGTEDYLIITPNPLPSSGDFTVEFWFRAASFGSLRPIWSNRDTGGTNRGVLYTGTAGGLTWWNGGDNLNFGSNLSTNTWYHIACVKQGSIRRLFVDGGGMVAITDGYVAGDVFQIGKADYTSSAFTDELNGHIDEFRVSSTAKYTANFTAPTAPFQSDANTTLLLHMDGTDASTVFTDDNGIAPYTP